MSDYDIPYNTSEDEYNDSHNDDNITPAKNDKIQETQKNQEPVKHKLQLKKKFIYRCRKYKYNYEYKIIHTIKHQT